MLDTRPYRTVDAPAWDAFVERSRNGNFLHRRGYMDYHADRFADASLVVTRDEEWVAVLPAAIRDDTVSSHAGLTYAGLISSRTLRAEDALHAFDRIGEHYRALGARRLVYKAVPHIFHAYPAEEDLYALQRAGARLVRRDLSSVIALREPYRYSSVREKSVVRAKKAGIRVAAGDDCTSFHALLEHVLRRHDAVPTHTLAELQLLRSRFPQQILLYEARADGELLAGVVAYDFGRTVHTQYLAASDAGRRSDALSLLLAWLIGEVYADRHYFSFGVSTEQEGRVLNVGLVTQKEHFGARAVVHDVYEWML
jgi:hypothetical protein